MVKVTYPLMLTVAANTSGKISVLTVPEGRKFRLTALIVNFPAGTENELLIRALQGIANAIPRTGWLTGDDAVIVAEGDVEYSAGSEVVIEYSNTNGTTSKSAFVLVEGEMI